MYANLAHNNHNVGLLLVYNLWCQPVIGSSKNEEINRTLPVPAWNFTMTESQHMGLHQSSFPSRQLAIKKPYQPWQLPYHWNNRRWFNGFAKC
jgi:hypothetical protein